MKYWHAIAVLVCFVGTAFAQDVSPAPAAALPPSLQVPAELDAGGVIGLLGDKLKETKAAALVTWGGKPGAAVYLPIWTWHTADGIPIAEFPAIGYRGVQGQKPDAFAPLTFNLPGLSKQWFGSGWFKAHVKKSVFPPVFFGPAVIVPLNLGTVKALRWEDWTKYAAIVLSVRAAPKILSGTP